MASDTGGVKPMLLEGRLARERERLLGMTNEDRAYRKQWLKDQELSPNEPRFVPEYERELLNPIRRAYRFPLDTIFRALIPVMGHKRAVLARYVTGKALLTMFGVFWMTYYFKYCRNDWTTRNGWHVFTAKAAVYPGDPRYPAVSDRSEPKDYYDRGFKNSPI